MGERVDTANIVALLGKYAVPVLLAGLVFVIGRMIANGLARQFEWGLERANPDNPSLSRFLASALRYVLLFVVILAALGVLGVDISAAGGMIAGAGVAFAFIIKDALADLAAGVMLVLFRPYSIGDEIEIDGKKGVVTALGLLATRMKTRNNIEIIVANGKAWGGVIKNHSVLGMRRLDMVFGISYDSDIDLAIQTLIETAAKDKRVYQDPAPWAKVVGLGESSVDIELRLWCDYDNLRRIKVEISQPVKAAFDAAGIEIPYPHEVKISKHVENSKSRARLKRLAALKST